MDTLRIGSAGAGVETLQTLLSEHGFHVPATGGFDEATRRAVVGFQRRYGLEADGIVGYRSWEALFFGGRSGCRELTRRDFDLAGRLLDVEPAALEAVKEVESGRGGGFLASGRPVILFEGHIFWGQLKKRGIDPKLHARGNEAVLYPAWDRTRYRGGEAEYLRLEQAAKIDRGAALSSASWGMFQIMGFNHSACGEACVESFVDMMRRSELHQLLLAMRFMKSGGMLPALQRRDWAEFARRYNGPAYAQNRYDERLARAYEIFNEQLVISN